MAGSRVWRTLRPLHPRSGNGARRPPNPSIRRERVHRRESPAHGRHRTLRRTDVVGPSSRARAGSSPAGDAAGERTPLVNPLAAGDGHYVLLPQRPHFCGPKAFMAIMCAPHVLGTARAMQSMTPSRTSGYTGRNRKPLRTGRCNQRWKRQRMPVGPGFDAHPSFGIAFILTRPLRDLRTSR